MLVLNDKHVIPYSFLNYIFISPQDLDNKQILLHELTHIRQRHTLDILFVEFIHCLMWFNPTIHFYKKAIRLNHEFLADEVVIKNYPTADYQNILFQKTKLSSALSLASSFNYSATKKRFIMMTTSKNQTRSVTKVVLTSILLLGTILIFSEKVYAQNDSIPQVIEQPQVKTDLQVVAEFDSLIRKFATFRKDKNGTEHIDFHITGITDGEKSRMLEIYKGMTKEQKAKYPTEIYIVFTPMPQPKKQSPTAQQMADFADPKVYGVWLDGKRIPNAELAKYKPSDIALVWTSRLMKNAAHYGQYKFHTDIMTHAYFDKTYPPKSE
jgi:bla regulator protein BlaR1